MTAYIRDRRKYSRIEKSFRVEYVIEGRRSMAFAVNLSMGGLLLRSASQLTEGTDVDFMLALAAGTEPLTLRGRVLGRSANQARVGFLPDQTGLVPLRDYFETVLIPELEASLEGPRPDTARLLVVARLYADFGRTDAALALYRSQLAGAQSDARLAEQMALFLLTLVERDPPYQPDLMPELTTVIATGLLQGDSEVLSYVQRTAAEHLVEQRRLQQEEVAKVEQQRQSQRLAQELQMRTEVLETDMAARRQQLEDEFAQRLATVQQELQTAHAADRAALAQERTDLQAERLQLETAAAAESRRTAAVWAELQVKQEALEQQRRDLATDRAGLVAQQAAVHGELDRAVDARSDAEGQRAAISWERAAVVQERDAWLREQAAAGAPPSVPAPPAEPGPQDAGTLSPAVMAAESTLAAPVATVVAPLPTPAVGLELTVAPDMPLAAVTPVAEAPLADAEFFMEDGPTSMSAATPDAGRVDVSEESEEADESDAHAQRRRRRLFMVAAVLVALALAGAALITILMKPPAVQSTASAFAPDVPPPEKPPAVKAPPPAAPAVAPEGVHPRPSAHTKHPAAKKSHPRKH